MLTSLNLSHLISLPNLPNKGAEMTKGDNVYESTYTFQMLVVIIRIVLFVEGTEQRNCIRTSMNTY